MLAEKADFGVFLCGSGSGMAIVANRFKYLYAAVAWDQASARLAREDDNVNVLCLPSDWLDNEQIVTLVDVWLSAEFQAGRYAQRLQMMDSI
jgi:ribose 5-phosphate isomerase B